MFVTLCKEEPHLIALSTKYHWKDGSDINLIIKGIEGMRNLTDFTGWAKIVMTRPGCGNGGLEWAKVKPVLDTFLDDRFIICNR